MKIATVRSVGGEWVVSYPAHGTVQAHEVNYKKSAAEAIEALNAFNDKVAADMAAEGSRPISAKPATNKDKALNGAVVAYYGDQATNGRFPAVTAYGSQLKALIAGLPGLVEVWNGMVARGEAKETFAKDSPAGTAIDLMALLGIEVKAAK